MKRVLLASIFVMLCASLIVAQEESGEPLGSIQGVVTDPDGKPYPYACCLSICKSPFTVEVLYAENAPVITHYVEPEHPKEFVRLGGVSAKKTVLITTDNEGNVVGVDTDEHRGEFFNNVKRAALEWKYDSETIDKIPFRETIVFDFDQEKREACRENQAGILTGDAGEYEFVGLEEGEYILKVDMDRYWWERHLVQAEKGNLENHKIKLRPLDLTSYRLKKLKLDMSLGGQNAYVSAFRIGVFPNFSHAFNMVCKYTEHGVVNVEVADRINHRRKKRIRRFKVETQKPVIFEAVKMAEQLGRSYRGSENEHIWTDGYDFRFETFYNAGSEKVIRGFTQHVPERGTRAYDLQLLSSGIYWWAYHEKSLNPLHGSDWELRFEDYENNPTESAEAALKYLEQQIELIEMQREAATLISP